jgi:hypothetical protein
MAATVAAALSTTATLTVAMTATFATATTVGVRASLLATLAAAASTSATGISEVRVEFATRDLYHRSAHFVRARCSDTAGLVLFMELRQNRILVRRPGVGVVRQRRACS